MGFSRHQSLPLRFADKASGFEVLLEMLGSRFAQDVSESGSIFMWALLKPQGAQATPKKLLPQDTVAI